MKLALLGATALITGAAVLTQTSQPSSYQVQQDQFKQVKAICDIAHNEDNGASEEACGVALDKTNTDYVCLSYTKGACWVVAQ